MLKKYFQRWNVNFLLNLVENHTASSIFRWCLFSILQSTGCDAGGADGVRHRSLSEKARRAGRKPTSAGERRRGLRSWHPDAGTAGNAGWRRTSHASAQQLLRRRRVQLAHLRGVCHPRHLHTRRRFPLLPLGGVVVLRGFLLCLHLYVHNRLWRLRTKGEDIFILNNHNNLWLNCVKKHANQLPNQMSNNLVSSNQLMN